MCTVSVVDNLLLLNNFTILIKLVSSFFSLNSTLTLLDETILLSRTDLCDCVSFK